jgi:methyl-accepting chemotaxis protein
MEGLARGMRNFVLGFDILDVLQASRETVDGLQGRIIERVKTIEEVGDSAVDRSSTIILSTTVVAVIGAVGLGLMFGHLLSAPVVAMSRRIEAMAAKDYATEIPGTHRGDEMGTAARAMQDLCDRLQSGEAEADKERRLASRRVELFTDIGTCMEGLTSGDLSRRMAADEYSDLGSDYVKLCQDFNDLAESIGALVGHMGGSVTTVSKSAQDLSGMADDLSGRAETQAATLEETVAALEELSKSVSSAAERAAEADTQVNESRRRAEEGGAVMERALKAMGSIAKSSDEITQIIGVIDDIAFQTNLLALNAGVEAARAGEAGKGFSVVASEVRQLAQRASESAREIKDLVTSSSKHVDDGGRLVQETGAMLSAIVASVKQVSAQVSDIAVSSKEQAQGLREINSGMNDLDQVTQRNAAMVNETTRADCV